MNTETIDNIKMIAETAREFAEKNIRPNIMEWDESQTFPKDLFHELGEMGFMGIVIPEQYGGSGLGYHEYVTILDEISQVDPSIGLSVAAHNSLCTNHIYEFGNEEQRNKWLPQLASGKVIGAWGLTEHNTGSDSGGMSTTAVKDSDLAKHHSDFESSSSVDCSNSSACDSDTKYYQRTFTVVDPTNAGAHDRHHDSWNPKSVATAEDYANAIRSSN